MTTEQDKMKALEALDSLFSLCSEHLHDDGDFGAARHWVKTIRSALTAKEPDDAEVREAVEFSKKWLKTWLKDTEPGDEHYRAALETLITAASRQPERVTVDTLEDVFYPILSKSVLERTVTPLGYRLAEEVAVKFPNGLIVTEEK